MTWNDESLGRAAFEAYVRERGGRNHDGSPTPSWEQLGEGIQQGWIAAAREVRVMVCGAVSA